MKTLLVTSRLLLIKLNITHASFIYELVNTPEWIKFIGERNIRTQEEAAVYVQNLMVNQSLDYWVVQLKDQPIPMGIITFIKRSYLEFHDIGFAFLPAYKKKGYAYEATKAILFEVIKNTKDPFILATTLKENVNSIKLLERLGLRFEKAIQPENTELLVYSICKDRLELNSLTDDFFSIFSNVNQHKPDWDSVYKLCLTETLIIKKIGLSQETYTLQGFITPRKKILSDGTLTEFEENEIADETRIDGCIAQRFSRYKKNGNLNGKWFQEYGRKMFQFVKTKNGWKISALIWQDDKH